MHEGPIAIRKKPSKDMREDIDIMPGMILSDEPGIYREGSYGIRIENQLLCTYDQEEGYYTWKPLTRVRLEDDLIDRRYMTDEDINAYNRYQKIRATYKSVG